jgi:hypothetical protein
VGEREAGEGGDVVGGVVAQEVHRSSPAPKPDPRLAAREKTPKMPNMPVTVTVVRIT